jgi:serine/threonine protein kinase
MSPLAFNKVVASASAVNQNQIQAGNLVGGGKDTNTTSREEEIEKMRDEIKEQVEKEQRLLDEIRRLKQLLEQQSKPSHVTSSHVQQLPTYLSDDTLEVHPNEYSKTEEIDSGNFARVYKGKHTKSNRDVVIKQIKGAAANVNTEQKFRSEVSKIRLLKFHPGTPKIEAFYKVDRDMCVVFQELSGLSVRHVMDENANTSKVPKNVPSLLPSELLKLTVRLIETVHFVHSTGIIHYDIKPDNILLCNSEYGVQLIDFGSAGFVSQTASTSNASTPHYASPEKLDDVVFEKVRREKKNMSKVDVWSLGATILDVCCSALLVTAMYDNYDDIYPYFTAYSLRIGFVTLDDDQKVPWELDLILSKYFEVRPEAKIVWESVDDDIKDIIRVCLTRDISQRPFVHDIIQRQSFQRLRSKLL